MYDVLKMTTGYMSVEDLTEKVKACVAKSGIKNGVCVVYNPHTTAGLSITSFWDKRGHEDIQDEMDRLFPLRTNYIHVETPWDAAGHIKCAVMGVDVNLPIVDGELQLGSSQGIYFFEFDGPRNREVWVKCHGDK